MSWHHAFPHENNDPDFLEQQRHFRQSIRPPAAPSRKDIEQDTLIHLLEQQTLELRIYVAALIRLLGKKGTISPEETAILGALAERVQQDLPPGVHQHYLKLADLIDPSESGEPSH